MLNDQMKPLVLIRQVGGHSMNGVDGQSNLPLRICKYSKMLWDRLLSSSAEPDVPIIMSLLDIKRVKARALHQALSTAQKDTRDETKKKRLAVPIQGH